MRTEDFNFDLPLTSIAQTPIEPRDHSKLMVLDRSKKTLEHKQFLDILSHLNPGDLLVWNNSKVFKARLLGKLFSPEGEALREHAKPVEIFLVRPTENTGVWQALGKPGKHIAHGMRVMFASDFSCVVMVKKNDGTLLVQFSEDEQMVRAKANQYGEIPLPPYIKEGVNELVAYQTVYAKNEGSVAAPTAGFHFTPDLIEKIKAKGIQFADVTLHVGLGTFLPVKSELVHDHTMHSEWVEVSEDTVNKIRDTKAKGGRVIAVGTTRRRTLEGIAKQLGGLQPKRGDKNIFITPGFEFQVVDALITNFHLPKSTLLMLVSAFANDREFVLRAYAEAVTNGYRFFSFGDAMFIS
jgi:S-adenosylmethionine:tRNA ribosyltransferase-isomerase